VNVKVDIISYVRSLSFGGLLGCGVAYLVFISYPHLFDGRASLETVVIFGSLLGAALHRAIDACLVKTFLLPFGRFTNYYGKLIELTLQHRAGLIDDELYKHIKSELDREYFLGSISKASVQERMLPPPKQ
jgi:hypothetical protein